MPKHALLIGVSSDQHPESLKPYPSAKRNVEAMGRILLMPEVGEFAEARPVIDPDPMQMQEAIEEFFRQRSPQDLALLFFSGQVVRDERGKLYLTTRMTRHTLEGSLVKYTAVPVSFVQELMGSCPARQQVLILDCGIGGTTHPENLTQRNGSLSLRDQLGGTHWVVLLSSTSPRPLPEHNGSDLSLYTHFLVEGMATGAADLDRDGIVSAQDLHSYTAHRVGEVVPEVVPQILALQEDSLHTPIARVPVLDSRRQYQEKVRQYVAEGGISPVGRTILDRLRSDLKLSAAEALTLETEVLQPFRSQWESLQRYRRALEKALEAEYPLGNRTLRELHELQDILGLTDDQVAPVHERVVQPFAERAEQQLQRRSQYRQTFEREIQRQFPLAEPTRQRLYRLQAFLGLPETEVRDLEAEAIAQHQAAQETHQRHLRHYREALLQALEEDSPIRGDTRLRLQKLQISLRLSSEDVARLEQQVNDEIQAKRAVYRGNLEVYRQEFEQAIARDLTPPKPRRDRLQQLQQELGLRDVDIIQMEAEVIRQDRLRRYEQEFTRQLQQVFLPSDATLDRIRRDLQPLQESLMLNENDVAAIQRQLAAHARAQRQDYHNKLQQYSAEYAEMLRQGTIDGDEARQRLQQIRQTLGVRETDAQEVEQILLRRWQDFQTSQQSRREQYRQLLINTLRSTGATQNGLPEPDEDTRTRLLELQHSLGITDREVVQMVQDILQQSPAPAPSSPAEATDPWSDGASVQDAAPPAAHHEASVQDAAPAPVVTHEPLVQDSPPPAVAEEDHPPSESSPPEDPSANPVPPPPDRLPVEDAAVNPVPPPPASLPALDGSDRPPSPLPRPRQSRSFPPPPRTPHPSQPAMGHPLWAVVGVGRSLHPRHRLPPRSFNWHRIFPQIEASTTGA